MAAEIDASFFNADLGNLPDQLSNFGDSVDLWLYRVDKNLHSHAGSDQRQRQVDLWLYRVDKNLRAVVQQINQLPRPGSFLEHKR